LTELTTALLVVLTALAATDVLTRMMRRYAIKSQLLDIPNSRSSHATPTPRGGGMAVVVVVSVGLAWLGVLGWIEWNFVVAALPAGLAIAAVGFLDDQRGVSAGLRLGVHLVASGYFVAVSGGAPELGIPWIDSLPALASAIELLGLVWLLNLFNFMDGIDGIAGLELAFASLGLALIVHLSGDDGLLFAVLLGAAGLGFLPSNWPPARIFMGDVGSGFAGIALGMLAIATVRDVAVTIWVPLILLGAFVTDATLTLLRRALRGEKWYTAHRTHAYQWLSRRWGGHRPVLFAVLAINFLWLLPLALMAQRFPQDSWLMAVAAYTPLILLAYCAGAGRAERN
jgi:Fuc2NAc and GlcNAc transferase